MSGMDLNERALLEALVVAARAAGAEILKLVEAGFEIETKSDESPVTVCDRAAEMIILRALEEAAPGVPVIADGGIRYSGGGNLRQRSARARNTWTHAAG